MNGCQGAKHELPAAANYTLKRKRARPREQRPARFGRMDGWMDGRDWADGLMDAKAPKHDLPAAANYT